MNRVFNDIIKPVGHVTFELYNKGDVKPIQVYENKNLVTYYGRDFCASRAAFTADDRFVERIKVGADNFPAEDYTDTDVGASHGEWALDSKTVSGTVRGRIIFVKDILGSFFGATKVIKEAGLFVVSASGGGPTVSIGMFSRVTIEDPGFSISPPSGGVEQILKIIWRVTF